MLWNKHYGNMQSIGAFEIITPPPRRTVEQLLALQEAISQVEAHVQAGNIFLLKLRSLMLAAFPQVPSPQLCFLTILFCNTVTLTGEICCLNLEHQQSCGCAGCCGYGIHVHATKSHRSAHSSRSIHETDASEEEEQREIGEEVKGVVAPDSSCTCTASEASGHHQEMEIEVEIKISKCWDHNKEIEKCWFVFLPLDLCTSPYVV